MLCYDTNIPTNHMYRYKQDETIIKSTDKIALQKKEQLFSTAIYGSRAPIPLGMLITKSKIIISVHANYHHHQLSELNTV